VAPWSRPVAARTVVYHIAPDGTTLLLDVWPAGSGAPRPAIVKVHGGGWTSGARNEVERWNCWLNRLGYHVFDVDYRLAPPPRWQDAVDDVKAALAWARAQAGVDPDRVTLFGHSAGGHLALLAAYTSECVRCVVNIYGPSELTRLYSGRLADELGRFVGGSPAEFPDRFRAASPITHAGSAVPTLTIVGDRDELIPVEQAELLDVALAASGVPHESVVLPGVGHSFDRKWRGSDTREARARVERFLTAHA